MPPKKATPAKAKGPVPAVPAVKVPQVPGAGGPPKCYLWTPYLHDEFPPKCRIYEGVIPPYKPPEVKSLMQRPITKRKYA